jgi:predicted nucleic acid-binding protein
MSEDDLSLVDTNILVYSASPAATQYRSSRALLESGAPGLCVAPQVLAEFYSVVTNPRRVTVPFTPAEACAFILEAVRVLTILPVPPRIVERWARLAQQYGVTGSDIFDLQLLATMLENGVQRIYTFNRVDFERFPGVLVLTP